MRVLKVTRRGGDVLFTRNYWSGLLTQIADHVPDWQRMELIEMNFDEFYLIKQSIESQAVFHKLHVMP